MAPEKLLSAAATPDVEAHRRGGRRRRARRRFHRKVEYLREFGRKINIPDVDGQILSQVMLAVLDEKWKDHLYDLDQLRNAIQYRAYGQKDPLVEYKREAFEMFEDLMRDIQATFTERFLKIQVTAEPPRRPPPPPPPRPAARGRRGARSRRPPGAVQPAGRPARASPAAPGRCGRRRRGGWRSRPERSLPVRVGQEVQEVPRGTVAAGDRAPRSPERPRVNSAPNAERALP